MTEEIDLDELERRLRLKWLRDAKPASVLAEEDRAVATKLLGKSNASRMAKTARGRQFKYKPPVYSAEYFFSPPINDWVAKFVGSWTINILENGVKRTTTPGLTEERCRFIVSKLEQKGIPVRKFETEAMRRRAHEPPPPDPTPAKAKEPQVSRRRQIIDQLKDFHL